MAPLDATEFSAGGGPGRVLAERFSFKRSSLGPAPAALEYLGVRRLAIGHQFLARTNRRGNPRGMRILPEPKVTIAEVDGRGRVGRLDLRGASTRMCSSTARRS